MNVLISAGHHPTKPGACWNGFCEHDEAVRWVQAIAPHLDGYAIIVPPGVLANKVGFINARSPTIAIEIHFNSAPDGPDADDLPDGEGSETLYYPASAKGKVLAHFIQSRLGQVFSPDRGTKEGWYQMNKEKGPDFFLQRTNCVSVIVEPEFITHKEKIQDNRYAGSVAIATGILEYLEKMT